MISIYKYEAFINYSSFRFSIHWPHFPTVKSRQKLVWADEFNGDSLDYSKWGVEENAYGGGNNEQQIYRWDKKNLRVENGNLVIEAHKDNPNVAGTTRPYSSARIQ